MIKIIRGIIGAVCALVVHFMLWVSPLKGLIIANIGKGLADSSAPVLYKYTPLAVNATVINSPLFWLGAAVVLACITGVLWGILKRIIKIILIMLIIAVIAGGLFLA